MQNYQGELLLPEILRHRPIREDVQVIDHISYMLSEASTIALESILNEIGVVGQLRGRNGFLSALSATTVYSKNRLNCFPFNNTDFELPTIFSPLSKPFKVLLHSDYIQFKVITEANGNVVDALVLNSSELMHLHKRALRKYNAEWSQGDYMPYIRLNNPSYYLDSDWFRDLKMKDTNEFLVFDTKRCMRFGEFK